jgi:hypothetical protein
VLYIQYPHLGKEGRYLWTQNTMEGLWGSTRLVTAISFIVLSAIVAAEKTITSFFHTVPWELGVAISLCSIVIAIGTAFGQSVKPGIK